jgi:uncharacterized protein with HEPN domain
MPRRDLRVTLLEMVEAADRARWIVENLTLEELDSDWESAYALRLALQIVGEAASRVPPETRDQHPAIPWDQIIGLRHVLVHGYDAVDLDILWQIASRDVLVLLAKLRELLRLDEP